MSLHHESLSLAADSTEQIIRAELQRLVTSQGFAQANRLARFLTFIVEHHLQGQTDRLKETVIGIEVYDRPAHYDPKTDSIVRTEARRLRKKLREYYETEGNTSRVTISVPTGGYVPQFTFAPECRSGLELSFEQAYAGAPIEVVPGDQLLSESKRSFLVQLRRYRYASFAAVACCGILSVAYFLGKARPTAPLQAIPLTTYIGDETSPTFSPDDSAVAFAWNGQAQDNYDIYTLRIGDPGPRRLTDDPSPEYSPVWSPNGRSIAFIRARSGQIPEVILLDPISGAQRKLAEARIVVNPQHHRLDWSVDSRWVVISEWTPSGGSDRIYAINVDDGQQFALTSPPKASFDGSPAISPDGKFLAFIRDASQFSSSLMVIPLGPGMKPIGTERRIDLPEFGKATSLNYPAWSSSSEVVLNVWNGQQNRRLYQVSTSSHRAPVLLGELGDQIGLHAISRSGRKLVYSRGVFDTNIWQYELTAQGGTMGNRLLIGSSRFDQQPAISPDGTRIAFETTRSGFSEVWVSLRDGSNAVPLTHFQAFAGSPRWSPDGTFIVFDGSRDDRTDADIYVVPSNGGEPRRVTKDPAADFMPSWATDGQSIYFCSTRTGHEEIWNIPVSGGEAKRITTHGGFESVPSPDGQWLYYSRTNTPVSSIWRIPAKGGEAVKIVDDVRSRTFDITTKGLYFLKGSPSSPTELRLFDVKTLQSETIAHFDRFMRDRLSVSRDDSRLLYTRVDQQTDDLMLVEHLR